MPYDICQDICQKTNIYQTTFFFIFGVLSLTIILSGAYTYQANEVCPLSIDISTMYIMYTIYYSMCFMLSKIDMLPAFNSITTFEEWVLNHIYIYQWPFQKPKMEVYHIVGHIFRGYSLKFRPKKMALY